LQCAKETAELSANVRKYQKMYNECLDDLLSVRQLFDDAKYHYQNMKEAASKESQRGNIVELQITRFINWVSVVERLRVKSLHWDTYNISDAKRRQAAALMMVNIIRLVASRKLPDVPHYILSNDIPVYLIACKKLNRKLLDKLTGSPHEKIQVDDTHRTLHLEE